MNTQTSPEIDVIEVLDESIADVKLWSLVVFNDDVNTFDFVIETLIGVCDHTPEQAEQCSIIVHHNGKCTVKTGDYDDLKPRCTKLLQAGLSLLDSYSLSLRSC